MGKSNKKVNLSKLKLIQFDEQKRQHMQKFIQLKTIKRLNVIPQTWWITNQQFQQQNIWDLFLSIKSIMIESLTLFVDKGSNIVDCIVDIKFNKLTSLQLIGCGINSIQSLSFIQIPFLSDLNLCSNHITNIKPLVKIFQGKKALRILHLRDNYSYFGTFNSSSWISRVKIGVFQKKLCVSMQLRNLSSHKQKRIGVQNINIFAKLQPKSMQYLNLDRFDKIVQINIIKCLKHKYLPYSDPNDINQHDQIRQFNQIQINGQ